MDEGESSKSRPATLRIKMLSMRFHVVHKKFFCCPSNSLNIHFDPQINLQVKVKTIEIKSKSKFSRVNKSNRVWKSTCVRGMLINECATVTKKKAEVHFNCFFAASHPHAMMLNYSNPIFSIIAAWIFDFQLTSRRNNSREFNALSTIREHQII